MFKSKSQSHPEKSKLPKLPKNHSKKKNQSYQVTKIYQAVIKSPKLSGNKVTYLI